MQPCLIMLPSCTIMHMPMKWGRSICRSHVLVLFTFEDIEAGLKKMANGKASDHMKIQAEFVKWIGDRARTWLSHILTHALHHGFPLEWQENWVQSLHKGGDKNSVTNYRTIMVSSTLAKLFTTVLEMKISSWATGQAGFRKEHRTTDHLITLRVPMDECRL